MISYKNSTTFTKTLHGVKFKPGEIHQVPGYINIPGFIPCEAEAPAVSAVEPEQPAAKKSTAKSTAKSTTEEV